MSTKIGVFVCVTLSLFFPVLCRRNLSTIRYHFTPCGRIGRDGPSYDECKQYYTAIDSPIIRDKALTNTHGDNFVGSQSFRPPRTSWYSLTIAGAAGGKGLCNIEYGQGLIVHTLAFLNETTDYLILVGQKGVGPCDSDTSEQILCKSRPHDAASCQQCQEDYVQWIQNQTNLDFKRTLNLSGGAGGGGTSFVGGPDVRPLGDVRVFGIPGGGGGSSAFLNYSSVRNLHPKFKNSTLNDSILYANFIYGNAPYYDPDIVENEQFRGYRVAAELPTAGAGGGIFSSAEFPVSQQDGRAVGRIVDFAIGGTHCSRNDFSDVPVYLRSGDGGFGGGGGGCGGGGGGGGFTGGAVLAGSSTAPGGGGYTAEYIASFYNKTYVPSDDAFNDGDGYVDIMLTDCGCVYECVVFEEEDQFECHCPNDTQLAPDLSDCYKHTEQDVTLSNATLGIIQEYVLRLVYTGNTTMMYRMTAVLKTEESRGACAVAFLGGDRREMIAVTEPIRGSGRVTNLALTNLNLGNGSFYLSPYVDWLPEPQVITGAIVISNGDCSIEDNIINITASIGSKSVEKILSVQHDDESALSAIVGSNQDTVARFITAALQIAETTPSDDTRVNPALSSTEVALAIVGGVLLAGIMCGCIIGVVVICTCRRKNTDHWSPPSTHVHHSEPGSSTLQSNHAYERYTTAAAGSTHSDIKQCSTDGYEVLSFETDGLDVSAKISITTPTSLIAPRCSLRESVLGSSVALSPRFGHSAPIHDFVCYNRSRADSGTQEWQYPRSSLVYLRELGEGQFGKVLLMKTQGIAGYRGSIPVAVKTLSAQEPDIIQKFLEEAELMKKFSHPNIVSILGVCTDDVDETSAPLMILEYMQYGDLRSFLEYYKPSVENSKKIIKEAHFFCFANDVAKAMEFLAESKFVHRDIAARNCLVGTNLVVKIADFGLARGVHDKDYYRVAGRQMLPVRTMAPESLLYGVFTTASDVWSYGVLLWEIVMYGAVPLAGMSMDDVIEGAQKQTLKHEPPAECPPVLSSLISQCHNHSPDQRPSFTDILAQLPL